MIIVNSPIYSICSPKPNTRHYNGFTREFKPRNADANWKTLTLLWSTTVGISVYTRPNHFVLCMDIKNRRNRLRYNLFQNRKSNIFQIILTILIVEQLQKGLKVRHVESLSTSSRSLNSSTLQTHCLPVTSKTSTNEGTFVTKYSGSNKKQCNKICCTVPIVPKRETG